MPVKRYELSDAQWLKIASLLPGTVLDPAALTTAYSSMVVFGLGARAPIGATCWNAMAMGDGA